MQNTIGQKEKSASCLNMASGFWTRSGWRIGLLLVILLASVFLVSVITGTKTAVTESSCLGVPFLPEEEIASLGDYSYQDYNDSLRIHNEFVAMDVKSSTIYISQQITENTHYEDLVGVLTVDIPGRSLYFLQDENWENLEDAVRKGYRFKLLVSDYKNTYMQYDVVFTSLPLLTLHGKTLFKVEELAEGIVDDMIETFAGRYVMFNPQSLELEAGHLQWRVRGASTKYLPKKSWKLNLKNVDNTNDNVDFLELGSDDDWILNSMSMEDSNIREMLFMNLWNELAAQTDYNYKMSEGKYVEVLINGRYRGLFILQRRVDDKYLELKEDTFLTKGTLYGPTVGYELVSPERKIISYEPIDTFIYDGDCEGLSVENYIDVSIFLQLFSAFDSMSTKNMFYLFQQGEDGEIVMIPWDTDMSMGSSWSNETNGFCYDYEKSVSAILNRREQKAMLQRYPDLPQQMKDRWFELRQSLFSLENITRKMDAYLVQLDASGAVERDQEKWGLFFEGQDTIDNLYRFVEERIAFLDAYYSE